MVEEPTVGGSYASLSIGQDEEAKSNVSAVVPGGSPTKVKALPYPSRRLAPVKHWPELPSACSSLDSSSQGVDAGGSGMPGGGGGGIGGLARGKSVGGLARGKSVGGLARGKSGGVLVRGKSAQSWSKSSVRLALSAPLLSSSDSEREQSGRVTPNYGMASDGSKDGRGSSSSSSPVESQESRNSATNATAGFRGGSSLAPPRGIQHRGSMRALQGTVTADVKTTELFAQPLASEGEGSVFPIALPMPKRRAYEADFIKQFDRLAINVNAGDFWAVIDATWMNNWVDFIMGNKPPPGPITNYNLYDQKSFLTPAQRKSLLVKHAVSSTAVGGVLAAHPHLNIKEGLQTVKDYRVIHALVWFIFREIYDTDGSPDIFRWRPDIYSAEVTGVRKARHVEEVHIKAMYQLRRFSTRVKESMEARGA